MATKKKQDIDALLAEIAALKQENNELKDQLGERRLESEDIDDILDEVEENEQKYQREKVFVNDNNDIKGDNEDDDEEGIKKKTLTFWNDLAKKLKDGDIEGVKDLVRTKQLKIDEVNDLGRNLLMMAAQHGSYELVSMCINLGADIDKEDNSKQTGLYINHF